MIRTQLINRIDYMAAPLHISISAEKLFSIAGLSISNSMVTSLIVSTLLIGFALWVRASLKKTNHPTGVQNVAEFIVESLYNLVQSVTGNHRKSAKFFPFIATFFLFILLNNWMGLIPGSGSIGISRSENVGSVVERVFVPFFRAGTADLNMTAALGLISVALIQFFGVSYLRAGYFKKFLNFSSPINLFVSILEIVSEVSRVISFAFRLFGNVFAGEVLLAVIGFLIPVIAPMPFYGLEIFVGFLQALVFSMLSVVLFNMATQGHGEEH